MLAFIALFLIGQPTAKGFERDSYGVPHISASSWDQAFYWAGYAVAEDRLWQMELSRRMARGKLAALLGSEYLNSDREVLRFAYTDEELRRQYDLLSDKAKRAISSYARGVNAYLVEASQSGRLPQKYLELKTDPEPWSEIDSVAIAIRLWRMFGRGGAGELRNMAVLEYLNTQNCKEKRLDVFDDMAWQNDPASPTTVAPEDDTLAKKHPAFPKVTRRTTERHLALLPKLNLLELLPSVRLASLAESARTAQRLNLPYKAGSYAIVVGRQRSATGTPLLLSAPQMGFSNPSIAHEMSIEAPGLKVCGMDVPGIPGVLIGFTPKFAWGLTSGVADLEDIFFFKSDGDEGYRYGDKTLRVESKTFPLAIAGEPSQTVTQLRTLYGPVVFQTKTGGGYLFARKSTYWQREMKAYDSLIAMYSAESPKDITDRLAGCPMTFNLFYAFVSGDIGYRYIGHVPVRALGYDPRFPVPASPETDWKGVLSPSQMPHVENPKSGLLTNWNNKAATWWPNGDTPVWGCSNRVSILRSALRQPKLNLHDLEHAAWAIARTSEHGTSIHKIVNENIDPVGLSRQEKDALAYLRSFDGRMLDGSQAAQIYESVYSALQEELFYPAVGSFMSDDFFRLAIQPSLVKKAFEGRTAFNYLGSRTRKEVATAAFKEACRKLTERFGNDPGLWRYTCPKIQPLGNPPIPYSNRGTYIQLIELRTPPRGRNVLPPGVSETGVHSGDQIELARAWLFKSMRL